MEVHCAPEPEYKRGCGFGPFPGLMTCSLVAPKTNGATAVKAVAGRLGNRPATCPKYYVHPVVLKAYADGTLFAFVKSPVGEFAPSADSLHPEEECVLRLIRKSIQSP